MINKPVWRDASYEDGQIEIFHVEQEFELYHRASALVLDHLLHHLNVLTTLESGYVHPTIARYYGRDDEESMYETVRQQCRELFEYYQRIIQIDGELPRAHLLNEVQARIPYLTPIAGEPHLG